MLRPARLGAGRGLWLGLVGLLLAVSGCRQETVSVSVPPLPSLAPPATVREALGAGDRAPDFSVELLGGGSASLGALRGTPLIINFWLTTCEPCIREMPLLATANAGPDAEGPIVIGVNYGEDAAVISAFLDGFSAPIDFPIGLDSDLSVTTQFEVVAFPTTYFIDSAGTVQYRRFGEVRAEHLEVGLERISGDLGSG